MSRNKNIGVFRFVQDRSAARHGGQIVHCDGHWTGHRHTHTHAGGQCADAIVTCVGADGPARILHTGTGSGGLGRAKSGM